MRLLNNETGSKSTLLTELLYLYVISFKVISIGSYTPLHTTIPGLEASPEVICESALSNYTVFLLVSLND